MIRLFKHYIPIPILLLLVIEAGVLFASIYAGTALRFVGGESQYFYLVGPIFPRALVFSIVMLSVMTAFGLHQRDLMREGEWGQLVRFVASFAVGLVVMLLIFYVFPDLFLGRGAFGLAFFLAFVGTALTRLAFARLFRLTALKRRVLLLGSGSRSTKVEMLERDENGHRKFNLVGCLPLSKEDCCLDKTRILNDQSSILSVAKKYRVDEIVVGVRERRNGGLPANQLLECKLAGIEVVDLSSFFERETGQIQIESLMGRVVAEAVVHGEGGRLPSAQGKVLRKVTDGDRRQIENNRNKSKDALNVCISKVNELKLDMKMLNAEYSFDATKVILYFTAEGRVDFRNLVKELAKVFRLRIELKQIGVRDRAKMVKGYGVCGQELCCANFIKDFSQLSIKMAKEQALPLNPSKISGVCGRIKCCMAYEFNVYKELNRGLPKMGAKIQVAEGRGRVINLDILKRLVYVDTGDGKVVKISMPLENPNDKK